MNTKPKSLEDLLENQQRKYSLDVVKETSQDEILALIDALEFSEKNYQHNHKGVEEYVRSNHLIHNRNGQASLPEIFQNIRKAVIEDSTLSNYGHADLLTRSLLKYQRKATPKTAQTGKELKKILQPIFSKN